MNRKTLKWEIQKNDCWNCISHSTDNHGYPKLGRNGKTIRIARFMWENYFGSIPSSLCVLHHCDNRKCINPQHLFLGTTQENTQDRNIKKRQAKGSKNGNSKLTEQDIAKIKRMFLEKKSFSEISRKMKISPAAISHIATGRTWKHMKAAIV